MVGKIGKSPECNQRSNEEMENTPGGQKWELIIKGSIDRHSEGFLQCKTFSPIGFCFTETPVIIIFEKSDSYNMGIPGKREIKCTNNLFIDDLKTIKKTTKAGDAHGILIQAGMDIEEVTTRKLYFKVIR